MGCARSGTTLLGLMLQAHRRIAIPSETRLLLPIYFARERFGDLGREENRRLLAEAVTGTGSNMFADLGLDPDEVTERIAAGGKTVGAAIGIVFRSFAERFGKPRWGDKRPAYHAHVWVVQRLFPDAQFINIVRDGRDCVASMRGHPMWADHPYWRVQTWMEAIDNAKQAQRRLRPDSFYELQYEQLVTEPEKTLSTLCEFLGESFHDAMLSPQQLADAVLPERKTWHARTRHEVSDATVGTFGERLEPWELQLCEEVMADHLRDYGYELSGAEPPAPEHLEGYHRVDAQQRAKGRKRWRKDRARFDARPLADTGAAPGDRQRRTAALESEVDALVSQRDALRSRLDKVTESRSWRWTHPLRRASVAAGRRRR